MKKEQGKIIIIVAPSGTGKSTLLQSLREEFPQLQWSVSHTTRPQRQGEVHGKDYFYIDQNLFKSMIQKGEFLEWAEVHSNLYGTTKAFVEEGVKQGKNLLFDLDPQGVDQFKNYFGKLAHAIFIEPPSLEILRQRLLKRGTESVEKIEERLRNAQKELQRRDDYDYKITNHNLDEAYRHLKEIVAKILTEKSHG